MKIAWLLLLVYTWASSSGDAATERLRFATEESLDEILEDETHTLTPVQLEIFSGEPLADTKAATWTRAYCQLLISCRHGTLQLDRGVEKQLVDTTFMCVSEDGESQRKRSIKVLTTAQEAQQILASIIYQPDLNYHSTWFGVTDPLCITRKDDTEIVRMQLSLVNEDAREPLMDTCVAVHLNENTVFMADIAGSIHEKKISVTSVNDPPTVNRESGRDLSVQAGGSCTSLSGFRLNDAEAFAAQSGTNSLVPVLTLQLNVKVGTLRVHRQSALQSGIHVVGSGKSPGDATLTWKFPDLVDSSLILKGAISDLNIFLPQVEYCSSLNVSMMVSDTLRVTFSDNGFCGDSGKESLSAVLVVPVRILPTDDLGELFASKTNITLAKHSARIPLRYTPGRSDEVECTIELKYNDGMLLGIDYWEGTLYRQPNMTPRDELRTSAKVLIPMRGLIVQFWGEKSERKSTSFKFARNVCAIQEVCHQLESVALYEESSDDEIIAAAHTLALDSESVTELQVIRYPLSRLWLIWNIPHTFSQAVRGSTQSRVSVQMVERRFRLQGKSGQIAALLKTLNVYSLMGGVWSHNRLNVTITALNDGAIRSQHALSTELDIFALPVLENIQLLHPLELTFDKNNEISLETTAISYPLTYITSTALRWTVRSSRGSIHWDPNLLSSAVVSQQISKRELVLQGSLVDLNAALSSIRIDASSARDDNLSFITFFEEQTYELIAVEPTKTISVQTLTTSSTEGTIVGSFLLGLDLPARKYPYLDLNIGSGQCKSTMIGANDDVDTISRKITQMACDAAPATTSDKVFRREVQSIRVLALYPAVVHELTGTFRVLFQGQSSDPISLKASIGIFKATILNIITDANGIEVSRNELPVENGFEWQVTFGTARYVGETFQPLYDETSVPFKIATAVIQNGRNITDLRLDTFFPGISLSVQHVKSASSGSLALELSFSSPFDDLPILAVESSTLASLQTAQVLDMAVKGSKSPMVSRETDLFRLQVQNHITLPLTSCANASSVENAIRDLPIDQLRVSVKRKASPFVSGRFDYVVVMSSPFIVGLDLVADGTAPLSKALFRSSIVDPGIEIQVTMNTVSMYLEALGNSTLVVSGEISARLSRMTKKLGIRLPASYLQVDFNQTLMIGNISLEGYARRLTVTIACSKGTVYFLHRQPPLSLRSEPINSTFKISGYFTTLKEALQSGQLFYSPQADATGYDKVVFTIESPDDQAVEILPIAIISRVKPPSFTLPTSPISVFENEYVSIAGVMLNLADRQENSLISRGITVNITARSGHVEIGAYARTQRPRNNTSIQIQGDVENINAALKQLRYRPPVTGTPTEDYILLSAHWTSESGEQASPATFSIPLKINRRPLTVNVLIEGTIVGDSSHLTTTMNAPLSLESLQLQVDGGEGHWSNCNRMTTPISGANSEDSCNVTLDVSLFAGHGLIYNRTEPFSQKQEEDSSLTLVRFIGRVAHANRFLQRQVYVPDAKFHGPDQVVINIKNPAWITDERAVAEDTISLPVFVSPDCEASKLFWADSGTDTMSFNSSTPVSFALPELLIVREGLEKGYCQDDIVFRVIVQADHGLLTSKATAPTTPTSFDDPRALIFEGRIWNLSLALKSLEYQFEINREAQIPVTANIEVHLHEEFVQGNNMSIIVSSALLRLKFVGDTWLSDILKRDTIVGVENTDILIGDEIILDRFEDCTDDDPIIISVHNGVVYAVVDGVNMEANSEQQISTGDKRHLRSIMSNLLYSPNPHFNGIDEINFRVHNQEYTLYVYVQAKNDPPELKFNLEERNNWYQYPRMFVPSLQLMDPDKNQMFQVDITVANGTLFVDRLSSSTFDGVTLELNSSSTSLRMMSRLGRLNTIFFQRLIEVIPNSCVREGGTMRRLCAASIELCADDGFISVCEELHMPEQDLFYQISVADWAKSLNVSTGSSLNISEAFEIHQRFDVMYGLLLRIQASSGFIHIDLPICGDLRVEDQMLWSDLYGTTQTMYAPDVVCLNEALASIQFQSAYGVNDSIIVQLELFSEDMRLLVNESIRVKVTETKLPKRINAIRTTGDDEPWLVTFESYVNLTLLANVSIIADPDSNGENEVVEDILELNVSCLHCTWKYEVYVPRVSYELAHIPSSRLSFLGLSDSLNTVLLTLKLTTNSNTSGAESIHFQLAPAVGRSIQTTNSTWRDSTNISIPLTSQFLAPLWEEQKSSITQQSSNDMISLSGMEVPELQFRSLLQLPRATLVPINTSIAIQANEEEVRSIGEILTLSGDRDDPTWFRMEARVSHGRLSIPTNICCVDIHETEHANKLDVVGPALALKNALTAAQFQANEHFSGKDSLEVTIALFSLKSGQENDSFSIPIEIIAINHAPTLVHSQYRGANSNVTFSHEYFLLKDVDLVNLEPGETLSASLFRITLSSVTGIFLLDDRAKRRVSVIDVVESESGYSNFTFEATMADANAVLATVLYAANIADPNCEDLNEIFVAVDDQGHGIETWAPKQTFLTVTISTCEDYDKVTSFDPLVQQPIYEPSADSEWDADRNVWARWQRTETQDEFTRDDALDTVQYLCSETCAKEDTVALEGRNLLAPPPPISQQQTIHLDEIYDVPVPRVTSRANLYYSAEDTAFQFPDLALEFADNNNNRKVVDLIQAVQRSQLWSAELSYRPTKYAYPRSRADDKRHRWVADFVGKNPPRFLCKVGNVFYFAASDEQHGEELWGSDGSTEGTGLVIDLIPGLEGSSPAHLVALNGKLIFTASGVTGREMWASGGSSKQTYLVADITPGPKSSNPQYYTLFQSQWLLFQAETDEFGVELFKTDGTEAGTVMVEDIWRGPRSSKPSFFAQWTASDGRARMYFSATSDSGRELWVSDAFSSFNAERNRKPTASNTRVGTFLVSDICSGMDSSDPQDLVAINSMGVFFSATDCIHGRELWVTDGSSAGTRMVKDLNVAIIEGSNPSNLVVFGSKVYFQAQADSSTGREMFVSDGSAAGTLLLVDLVPGPLSSAPMSLLPVGPVTIADGTTKPQGLSFSAFDSAGHHNIYLSDGTKQGMTPLLDDIFLYSHNLSFSSTQRHGPVQQQFLEFNNALYFVTHESTAGRAVAQEENSLLYQLEIRVSYGSISTISTDRLADADHQVDQTTTSHLKLEGSVSNLEHNLQRLVYFPPRNWNEEQFPGGHIVECQFVVSYENKSVESFADLVIMSRVDAPVISVPQALEDSAHFMSDYLSVLRLECLPLVCDEDIPMGLDGFVVRTADATQQQVTTEDLLVIRLSVSHGVISLGDNWQSNCISRFVGAQLRKRVSFEANADCMNRIVAGMEYVSEPNFSGVDHINIRIEYARRSDAAYDEVTVPIIVMEVNDAPFIDVDSVFYEAEEDISLVIDDLCLRDPDALDASLRVIMEAGHGQLALVRSNGITLTTEGNASRLTLDGTLRNLEAALASVVYTSAQDWNSLQYRSEDGIPGMNGFDTITINATDFSSVNGSSMSVLFVYVDPQPDPVVIRAPSNDATSIFAEDLPGTLHGDEDTWILVRELAFSSADDTSHSTLTVSLSVTHGLLVLSQVRGLTFLEGATDGGRRLKLKGTFTNVNVGMIGLRYLPSKDFYGQDSLVVDAYAVDEYTQQQTPSSLLRVAITVDAVNDAPVWNIGSSIVREIQQNQAARLKGIAFHDVDIDALNCDVESCVMDLIVETSDGFITLPNASSTLFSNEMDTNKATYWVLSGTPYQLNLMLSDMIFELDHPKDYRGDNPSYTDIKLQLTVDDRGTNGWGGPQISTTTVVFNPILWSRYEFSIIAPEDVLTLDEDTEFAFDGNLQLAHLDSALPSYNLLEVSISCTHGVFTLSSQMDGIQVLRNDSDGHLVIRGFFTQLNVALNGSSYIPKANWYGSDELSLSIVETNRLEKSKDPVGTSVFLFVVPVCDEPHWVSPADEPFTMTEDQYLLINTLSLTTPDLDDEQREVEIVVNVKHGGVMLSMTRGLLVHQAVYSTSEDTLVSQHAALGRIFSRSRLFFKDLVVSGRISDINAALKGMVFKPWLDYNSDGWPVDEIVINATSVCGNSTTTAAHVTIPIAVDAVNDHPVLISQHFQPIVPSYTLRDLKTATWRSSIEAVEDSPQRLESTELYDPDYDQGSRDLRLLVNISCIHCTITSESLSHPSETSPSDDLIVVTRNWKNNEGVQLVVHGDVTSLNNGLMNQLIFRGAENVNGLAFVLVEISDLGNYGVGGELRSVFVLSVKVDPVNDIPYIHLPQFHSQEPVLQLDEGASILIQGARPLAAVISPGRRQPSQRNLMIADLLANDSSSRFRRLHPFLESDKLAVSFVVSHNGGLLFSGEDANSGQELWYSDGTAEGTVLLKDIFPGRGSSRPSYLTPFSKDSRAYFAAEGPHLSWLVKEDYKDTCQSFRPSSFDPHVFFAVAAQNVWDPEETYDCPLGFRWMSTSEARQIFIGTIAMEGHNEEPLTYFDQCGWRGYEWGGQTRMYFRFLDSKTTGAYKHAGFRDSYRVGTDFQTDLFAGIVCYRESLAYQITYGTQLWTTDGTREGTKRLARISTDAKGSNPSHFVELNERLYFQATSTDFGSELWSTDGTRVGTYLVADIEFGSRSSEPQFLIAFNSRVFFSAKTQDYGRELWVSDGDPRFEFTEDQHATVGTALLRDICAGATSSSPQYFAVLSPLTGPSLLLFQADDCVYGPELWSTDGTRAGTALVLDINKGAVGSRPAYLTSFAGQVYFQADDGIHGSEVWVTDGTSLGTVMLVDIAPGVMGSKPSFFTVLEDSIVPSGVLVFAAQTERDRRTEFWRSDGSSAGTTKLFPQSREVVELNTDSLNLQLVGHKFVSILSQPQTFFYLGQETRQELNFQHDWLGAAHAEDVDRTRSITLQDVEAVQGTTELTVSLTCSKGWLSLGRQCDGATVSLDETPDNRKAAILRLKGSLTALNCAVEKVTYHAKPQENGWDEIHVTVVQSSQSKANSTTNIGDDSDLDSSYTVSKHMLVEICAINDPPIINMASTFYAPTGEWVALAGIQVTDPDSAEGILYLSIAVHNGRLRVKLPHRVNGGGPTSLHPTIDGDTSQTLEFATTAEQTKEVFGALEYSCNDDHGCNLQLDYLTVQVDDNGFTGAHGPQVATKTAEIVVIDAAEAFSL